MKIKYISDLWDVSCENLIMLFSSDEIPNFSQIDGISPEILADIDQHREKKENIFLSYFIGKKHIKNLKVILCFDKTQNSLVDTLGKYVQNFWEKIAICASSSYISTLFDVSILARYSFQEYKSKKTSFLTEVVCNKEDEKILKHREKTLKNIFLARDLWETPAQDLTPNDFAKRVKNDNFKQVKVSILDEKQIQKKGLGLLYGVGKGSANPPRMVILEYITNKKAPVYGIVWKGVTFDTGGNQIKPGDFMYDMKGDMGGAAVTYALMREIDRKKPKINVVACLCLAENVVSDNSFKPSDILTGYSGKTVEIIHTDAEGRLVLADGMAYLSKKYKTSHLITIATLTGACMVALGYRYAGVMGNDENMIESLLEYSKSHSEKYIRLPFDEYLKEKTKSKIADLNNLDRSVHAGASMWAAFLSNFCENNEAYTHIDIAWAYINEGEAYGKMPKGMTGFGVESLSEIFESLNS